MNINSHQSNLKTLKKGDPDFTLVDGPMIADRAGFEITDNCPREYMRIIQHCYQKGWLKPVATVYEHEMMWNALRG